MLLNDQENSDEIKEEIKKYIEIIDNENMKNQNLWGAARTLLSNFKMEIYSNSTLPQEIRKVTNKQSNVTYEATGERRIKNPKVSRRKEIIQIRTEINEIGMKKARAKIIKFSCLRRYKYKPLDRILGEKKEEDSN